MQLSKIYCDNPSIFGPIHFNCAGKSNIINVIFGAVKEPENKSRDSHNLGKTTLIDVIDFLLLKEISGTNHFLATHAYRFKGLTLFFEIRLNSLDFITIRRSIDEPNQIGLKRHEQGSQDFTDLTNKSWDHTELPLSIATEILDGILNLRVIEPYSYRKALTYFLRKQADYTDVLQLQKFQVGQHKFWKPFVMTLLGFDESPVQEKYKIDQQIENLEAEKRKREAELQVEEHDLLKMNAELESLRAQLNETEEQLDHFQFSDTERKLMETTVNQIEVRISEINDELYDVEIDLRNIEKAIKSKMDFKISEIDSVFSEAGIHFPDQVKRSYEQLVNFNKALSKERNNSLRERQKRLLELRSSLLNEKYEQDSQRMSHRNILQNSDTLDKFKSLQIELTDQKAALTYLEGQYARLSAISDIEEELNIQKLARTSKQILIRNQIIESTETKDNITNYFRNYCKRVLDHEGLFYIKQNSYGNVEFIIGLKEKVSARTSRQADGKSYRQMTCALFDLALLKTYENSDFFHFVYHDGILEGLDNRKKRIFLDLVREVITPSKIQYILSVIESDLPRDENGSTESFRSEEIILQLDDSGDEGRLFRMPEF